MQLFKIGLTEADELLKRTKSDSVSMAKAIKEKYELLHQPQLYDFSRVLHQIRGGIQEFVKSEIKKMPKQLKVQVNESDLQGVRKVSGELEQLRKQINSLQKMMIKERMSERQLIDEDQKIAPKFSTLLSKLGCASRCGRPVKSYNYRKSMALCQICQTSCSQECLPFYLLNLDISQAIKELGQGRERLANQLQRQLQKKIDALRRLGQQLIDGIFSPNLYQVLVDIKDEKYKAVDFPKQVDLNLQRISQNVLKYVQQGFSSFRKNLGSLMDGLDKSIGSMQQLLFQEGKKSKQSNQGRKEETGTKTKSGWSQGTRKQKYGQQSDDQWIRFVA